MSHKKQASSSLVQQHSALAFLDKYIPENLLSDVSERFKARTLLLLVSILFLLSSISMGIVLAVDQSVPLRRFITISLIASQVFSYAIMWRYKSTHEASWYIIVMLLVTVIFVDYNNQSFGGPFTITWILPTSICVMLLGGKAALKITLLAMIGMSINFTLYNMGLLPDPIAAKEKWLNLEFGMSICIIFIVTFCLYVLYSMTKIREQELSLEIESRKRIAKELEAARDIAEEAAKNKTMFLATMSHELRTPLNSILGNAELLSRETLEEKTKGRVNDINSAGQLLISIINDVLDISKFDSYGIELNIETYDISAQIKSIHRMMEPKVKPGVEFILQGVDKPILIKADQNRLSQVILNLVSNAQKFTEAGTIKLSLLKAPDNTIKIIVADSGVGITDEEAKTLFHDFVQVRKHSKGQVEGTGLGLAIIQRIVDRMAGTVCLDSIEGKGSTFTVNLPIEVITSDESDQTDNSQGKQGLIECDLSSLSVLIVDDVAMNCIILKALLEELGVKTIHQEHDGENAVELIRAGDVFDVILMDIRMPKMDGLEASKLIRSLAYEKPIIAVTANAFEEDRQACLDSGMDGFLSKPLDIFKLKEVIENIVIKPAE